MSLSLPSPQWLTRRPAVTGPAETVWEPVVCATPGCPRRDREAFETDGPCPGCGQVLTAARTVLESPGWWSR
jgi:hypothetical protein